ncbi:unnamed protein product [Protopolystoma xenopodis]|uniref:Uncharacterized protein n=1 Tax=Protopolystoma xenopodis TaxID=117903 RepID=A0A448XMW0_9PLAT|nr:unnamed protein product [Protopolystoma xenopodis]
MAPSSDDVHHMMGESSALFYPKRGRKSRGLRQHEYRIKSKRLQYNEIHPSSSACLGMLIKLDHRCKELICQIKELQKTVAPTGNQLLSSEATEVCKKVIPHQTEGDVQKIESDILEVHSIPSHTNHELDEASSITLNTDADLRKELIRYQQVLKHTESILSDLQVNVNKEEHVWQARLTKSEEICKKVCYNDV